MPRDSAHGPALDTVTVAKMSIYNGQKLQEQRKDIFVFSVRSGFGVGPAGPPGAPGKFVSWPAELILSSHSSLPPTGIALTVEGTPWTPSPCARRSHP